MTPNADLIVSRIIRASPAAIWAVWKDPALLAQWWAPAPVVTIVKKHEFCPGGAFDTVMRLEDGTEFGVRAASSKSSRTAASCSPTPSAAAGALTKNRSSPRSSRSKDHPEGTKYTAVARHKNAEDREKHAGMGFVDGWGKCIEQLGRLAEQIGGGSGRAD